MSKRSSSPLCHGCCLARRWARQRPVLRLLAVMVVLLAGCARPVSTRSVPVAVAAYPDPEQQMLAALTITLLRAQGFTVIDRTTLKSEWHVRQALEAGSVHIAWQNSGPAWFTYLGHDKPVSTEASLYREIKAEDFSHGIVWLSPVSWSTRESVLMRSDRAAEIGISTIEGLANHISRVNPRMSICVPESLAGDLRGVAGMQRVYGFRFAPENIRAMSFQESLAAVLGGSCDCTIGSAKDLALYAGQLTLLRDNSAFFPAAILAPTVYVNTLNQYPDLERILGGLTAKLDSATLAELERQVATGKQTPGRTAERYLEAVGLVK